MVPAKVFKFRCHFQALRSVPSNNTPNRWTWEVVKTNGSCVDPCRQRRHLAGVSKEGPQLNDHPGFGYASDSKATRSQASRSPWSAPFGLPPASLSQPPCPMRMDNKKTRARGHFCGGLLDNYLDVPLAMCHLRVVSIEPIATFVWFERRIRGNPTLGVIEQNARKGVSQLPM